MRRRTIGTGLILSICIVGAAYLVNIASNSAQIAVVIVCLVTAVTLTMVQTFHQRSRAAHAFRNEKGAKAIFRRFSRWPVIAVGAGVALAAIAVFFAWVGPIFGWRPDWLGGNSALAYILKSVASLAVIGLTVACFDKWYRYRNNYVEVADSYIRSVWQEREISTPDNWRDHYWSDYGRYDLSRRFTKHDVTIPWGNVADVRPSGNSPYKIFHDVVIVIAENAPTIRWGSNRSEKQGRLARQVMIVTPWEVGDIDIDVLIEAIDHFTNEKFGLMRSPYR